MDTSETVAQIVTVLVGSGLFTYSITLLIDRDITLFSKYDSQLVTTSLVCSGMYLIFTLPLVLGITTYSCAYKVFGARVLFALARWVNLKVFESRFVECKVNKRVIIVLKVASLTFSVPATLASLGNILFANSDDEVCKLSASIIWFFSIVILQPLFLLTVLLLIWKFSKTTIQSFENMNSEVYYRTLYSLAGAFGTILICSGFVAFMNRAEWVLFAMVGDVTGVPVLLLYGFSSKVINKPTPKPLSMCS